MPPDVTGLVQELLERVAAAEPLVATQLGMTSVYGIYKEPASRHVQ